MSRLAESQGAFVAALRDPNQAAPDDICRPNGARTSKRFDVYRNNVAVSLIEAVGATYPAVLKLVGEDFFKAATRVYVTQEPPRSPVLLRYGSTFPDFLEAFGPARSVPYLADVARLEWARLTAYHAADAEPLDLEALGTVPPEKLDVVRMGFHPSAALIKSTFPIVSIWSDILHPEQGIAVDMTRGEEALVVRPRLDVESRILPAAAYPFMKALFDGDTLGRAVQSALAVDDTFDLATHLAGLFQTGAVVSLSTDTPEDMS